MITSTRFLLLLFLTTYLMGSCQGQDAQKVVEAGKKSSEEKASTIAQGAYNARSGIALDSSTIPAFLALKPLFKEFSKDYQQLYSASKFNYIWYDNSGLIESASALISSIENLEAEGVQANVPYRDSLDQLLHNWSDTSNKISPNPNTELLLTGWYIYYARKVYAGNLSSKTDALDWFLPKNKLSYADLLKRDLDSGAMTGHRGIVANRQYIGLKKSLAAFRDLQARGENFISGITTLSVGQEAANLPQARKRLFELGYLSATDTAGTKFSGPLVEAVNKAKASFGLKGDSKITAALISELNVPAQKRTEQIMVNMERLRWMRPDSVTAREAILVNIPEFTLHYYEQHKEVWSCGVVVGKPVTRTVIFSGMMKYVVMSPYWNVPPSIIKKEIRPGMARKKNYLAAHNMEWNGGNVRQRPGPRNSLGLVKFLSPNSYNIYLHDSPAKSLFEEDRRAYSHGCIRVAKARDLAVRILKQDPEWTPEKIDAAMNSGKEKYVTLKRQIPVYIGYFTAFISAEGQINFRRDIYNRDQRLLDLMMQN